MPKMIVSFGFKYGAPNSADGPIIDVRRVFNRNPYRSRNLRYKRGTDAEVAADVEQTPGFQGHYDYLKNVVAASDAEVFFLGCTGGHHRSVYLAERIARELGCLVVHRDISKT